MRRNIQKSFASSSLFFIFYILIHSIFFIPSLDRLYFWVTNTKNIPFCYDLRIRFLNYYFYLVDNLIFID